MKKLLLILLCLPMIGFAQYTELKLNPFGLLWDRPDISLEQEISDKIAIEFVLSARYGAVGTGSSVTAGGFTLEEPRQRGIGLIAVGKLFNPFDFSGFNENTYCGIFARYNRLLIYYPDNFASYDYRRVVGSIGFVYGYKYVSRSDWIFDSGVGFGRALIENNEFVNQNTGSAMISFKTGIDYYYRFLIGKRF